MKLQRLLNRKLGKKTYSKWVIIIPPEIIEQLRWKEGIELIPIVKGEDLRLTPDDEDYF